MAKRKVKSKDPLTVAVGLEAIQNVIAADTIAEGLAPIPPDTAPQSLPVAPLALAVETPVTREATDLGRPSHTERAMPERDAADNTRPPSPASAFTIRSDLEAGVRLLEDRRYKQMQIAFVERPSEAVRYDIGNAGYRWQSKERVWSKQLDADKPWQSRAEADALFETVASMIREEKGLGQHR